MGSIKYFAKTISESSESSRWFATNGDIEFDSIKEVALQSKEKLKYDIYEPSEDVEADFEVEEIKIKTALVEGSEDEHGITLKDGMIYGGVYVFEVVKFKNGKVPNDVSTIHWGYRYETENGVGEGDFHNGTGRKISVSLSTVEVCGRNLTIYAYIKSKESGASTTNWVHYRFRYFSRARVIAEVEERLTSNYKISQNTTSLCGMAAIFYTFLRIAKDEYKKLALDLHQKGEVTLNKYTIRPRQSMYEMQPFVANEKYPGYRVYSNGKKMPTPELMPFIDWIVMASARSSESSFGYTGESGQNASAINWGSVMEKLLKDFMGYTTVIDKTSLITGFNYTDTLIQMQSDYQEGYQIILLIDSDMLDDSVSYLGNLSNWHYIVYEGGLFFDTEANKYRFTYFTWGELFKDKWFRASVFNSNFYGYYKIKK